MGIKTAASNICWKGINITTRELREIISFSKNVDGSDQIHLDVDVNNIAYIYANKSTSYDSLVLSVAMTLKDLAFSTGFLVTCILDGNVRPHSKRDSFRRRFHDHLNLLNSSFCRQSALAISTQQSITDEEKSKLLTLDAESKNLITDD